MPASHFDPTIPSTQPSSVQLSLLLPMGRWLFPVAHLALRPATAVTVASSCREQPPESARMRESGQAKSPSVLVRSDFVWTALTQI